MTVNSEFDCKCRLLDEDVLEAALRLQKCKDKGFSAGQVIVHFTPQGKINLDQLCWHSREHKKIYLTS